MGLKYWSILLTWGKCILDAQVIARNGIFMSMKTKHAFNAL
jgi:hypothetical protein